MTARLVPIALSLERVTLERLEKYLLKHSLHCQIVLSVTPTERFALSVAESDLDKAQQLLSDISLIGGDLDESDEVIEVRCDESERIEIAGWLQVLLNDHDEEGSPIFFYRVPYEELLDAFLTDGRAEIPFFLLRGLLPLIPEAPHRLVMSRTLQEFFHLIETVSAPDEV